ncbi:MAG: hypothetical protein LC135_12340 [Phycisphaerae bacterium]|jgi:ABC-type multidrug transport system permease subunit|nr:hypothetical protein [Phycisphaerae bacterium]MCZ2400640.1 hypothetical protein [Phycisphaerae bacterium]
MKNLMSTWSRKLAVLSLGGTSFVFVTGGTCLTGGQYRNFVQSVGDAVIAIGVNSATSQVGGDFDEIVGPPAVTLFQDLWGNYIDPDLDRRGLEN